MKDAAAAKAAIESLNGFRLNDRAISLNEARPKLDHDETRDSSREHRRHKILEVLFLLSELRCDLAATPRSQLNDLNLFSLYYRCPLEAFSRRCTPSD